MRRVESLATDAATLQQYLNALAHVPRLTPDEEHVLAVRARTGDEDARRRLVEGHLRFVVSCARHYQGLGVSLLDLIHEGNLGLIEAARRFDPDRGVHFVTYAVWWIRQALLRAVSDQSRAVAMPARLAGAAGRLERVLAETQEQLGRAPSNEELAVALHVSPADTEALLHVRRRALSLSAPLGAGDDDELALIDTLAAVIAPADEDLAREALLEALDHAILDLTPREREIVRLRYGFGEDEPHTLQDIGDRLHLTRERIRQIESRAREKLRRSRELRPYIPG